jgi:hypothetical protein
MPVQYEPWGFKDEEQKIDLWGFKLLDGDFAGTTISINNVEMEDNNQNAKLDFTFIRKPEGKTEEQLTSEEFNNIMAEVVNDILRKTINELENRDGNFTKSNQ